jgi:hypothetical protein
MKGKNASSHEGTKAPMSIDKTKNKDLQHK